MSTFLTVGVVKNYVKTMLGVPVIVMEVLDEQLDTLINVSLEEYGRQRPIKKIQDLSLVVGQQAYVLTNYGLGVIEVGEQDILKLSVDVSTYDIFRYNQFEVMRSDPGDYYAGKMWREEVKRAVGSDLDWWYVHDTHTLFVNVSTTTTQIQKIFYLYVDMPTLTTIPQHDDMYIKKYTLALTKQVLGRIRGKFGGAIPGAEGSITLDASELKAEGIAEQEALDSALSDIGDRLPPMLG